MGGVLGGDVRGDVGVDEGGDVGEDVGGDVDGEGMQGDFRSTLYIFQVESLLILEVNV